MLNVWLIWRWVNKNKVSDPGVRKYEVNSEDWAKISKFKGRK
jgi:hypothetical protein